VSGFLISLAWLLLFVGGAIYLAYNRVSLLSSTIAMGAILLAYLFYGSWHPLWMLILIVLYAALIIPNLPDFRREKITRPALNIYRTMLPSMSDTEREALEAGNTWWDENFAGCSMTGTFRMSAATCHPKPGLL
jgi:acyl-CoA dehydrogenase